MMASVVIGTMTSNVLPTRNPKKSGGVTPTIVKAWPSSEIERPSTDRIAAVLTLPESVAQHRDRRAAARGRSPR